MIYDSANMLQFTLVTNTMDSACQWVEKWHPYLVTNTMDSARQLVEKWHTYTQH